MEDETRSPRRRRRRRKKDQVARLVGDTGLTEWGLSILQKLDGASGEQRQELGRRACADAMEDADLLGQVQLSLFEKLEIIHRHELWRFHVIDAGPSERPCDSMEEFMRQAVAPRVQHNRHTMHRMHAALGEASRLREEYGTCKSSWTVLGYLAAETRRQDQGEGQLIQEEHERLSSEVAEGKLTQRDVLERLRGNAGSQAPTNGVSKLETASGPSKLVRTVRRTTTALRLVAKSLEEIEFRPIGSWEDVTYQELSELLESLERLRSFHPDRVAACCRVVDAELIIRGGAARSARAS